MNDDGPVSIYLGKFSAIAAKAAMGQAYEQELQKTIEEAREQAAKLSKGGGFLSSLVGRLTISAHAAEVPEPTLPDKLTDDRAVKVSTVLRKAASLLGS